MQGQRLEGVLLEKPEQASFLEQPIREPVLACEDNLSFMERLHDGQMKLVVTSPPYNLGKDYEDKTSLDAYIESQERVIRECVRLPPPAGIDLLAGWELRGEWGDSSSRRGPLSRMFRALGLKLRNRIVWHFGHGLHCTRRLSGRYETINWWTKSDDYTWNLDPIRVPSKYPGKRHFKGPNVGKLSGNPKGKNPSDVWVFPNVKSNHPEKTIHPCQFPRGTGGTSRPLYDQPERRRVRPIHGSRLVRHRRAHARPHGLRLRHSGRVREHRA